MQITKSLPILNQSELNMFLFYYIMSPPPPATNIETSLKDNKVKYIHYE